MARAGLTADRPARAGAELADEIGFEHVTVAEVARRFKVRPVSLYSHVQSSADLKTRIALLALQELADHASSAVAGCAGKDALAGLAGAYRDYAHAHPGRFAAAQLRLDAGTAAASAGPRLSQLMRANLRGYPLTEADEVHAIRLLGSTIRGDVTLEMNGSFSHSPPDSDESWLRGAGAHRPGVAALRPAPVLPRRTPAVRGAGRGRAALPDGLRPGVAPTD